MIKKYRSDAFATIHETMEAREHEIVWGAYAAIANVEPSTVLWLAH